MSIYQDIADDHAHRLRALFRTMESEIRALSSDMSSEMPFTQRFDDLALLAEMGASVVDLLQDKLPPLTAGRG